MDRKVINDEAKEKEVMRYNTREDEIDTNVRERKREREKERERESS